MTRLTWLSNTVDVLQAKNASVPLGLLKWAYIPGQSDIKEECLYTIGRYKVTYSKCLKYQ